MATLVRWEPLDELAGLQNEMSRLMNGLLEGNGQTTQSWVPALDVWETENEVVYAFDLPGIPEDEISVEVEDGSLTVTASATRTNETSDDRFYRFERRHGTFTRTFGLPQGVSEEAIAADYPNGVLEIHVREARAGEAAPDPGRRRRAGDDRGRGERRSRASLRNSAPEGGFGRPQSFSRQAQREERAAAGRVRRLDLAAVRLGDVPDDREPEARAGQAARGRGAVEALEDEREVSIVEAGAVVAHGRRAVPRPSRRRRLPGGLHLTAFTRMFATARCRRSASPRTDVGSLVSSKPTAGRVAPHSLDLALDERVEPHVLEPGLRVAVERELDHVA